MRVQFYPSFMDSMSSNSQSTPDYEQTQAANAEQISASAALSATAPNGFELRDEVGRGGMGIVYRAIDLSLNREIAIKLLQDQIPAESSTAARFNDEARITAQLQHPAIPAVHQMGVMPSGRPYLAMKLIKGDTLDRLLKASENTPASQSRFIDIFEKIAQALAYAHSRHVIHRDLKPANIMVGAFGEVQVMDWGLAKVLGERTSETGAVYESDATTKIRSDRDSNPDGSTQYGQFMGTPAYMPPEQAIGAIDRIDERSDVFGLGAILCVILTGQPPFVSGNAETTRQLAARGKVEDAFERLDACGADPELIALAKRCLAVEPQDRPAHAGELAAAIADHRAGAEERARKLELDRAAGQARRRAMARAAIALFVVLAAGIGISSWQAIRATQAEADTAEQLRQTRIAEAKEREAREEADRQKARAIEQKEEAQRQERIADERRQDSIRQQLKTETVMQFMLGILGQSNPWDQIDRGQASNPNRTIREVLELAAKRMDERFEDDGELEARIREAVGTAYYGIGLYPEATKHLLRATEILKPRYSNSEFEKDDTVLTLARCLHKLGRFADAEILFQKSIAARESAFGPDNPGTLTAIEYLANMKLDQGLPAESEKLIRRVATTFERTVGPERQATLNAWMSVADTLRMQDRAAESIPIYERVIAGLEQSKGKDHPNTLYAVNNLALVLQEQRNFQRAEQLYLRAIDGLERRLGPDHDEPLIAKLNLANCYRNMGQLNKAQSIATEIYQKRLKIFGPKFPNTLHSGNQLGLVYRDLGNDAEAEKLFRLSIAGLTEVLGPNHPETSECMTNLAEMYRFLDRLSEAEPLYLAVRDARIKHFGPDHTQTLHALNNIGTLREAQGRYVEAEAIFRKVIAAHEKTLGLLHQETLMSQFNLGYVFMSQNRYSEAEAWLRKAYEGRKKTFGEQHVMTSIAGNWLLLSLENQEKYEEAEPMLRQQFADRERENPQSWLTSNTRSRLGRAVLASGQTPEARKLILDGFEQLKARQEEIPFAWRGLRLREAAQRVIDLFEQTGKPAEAQKWKSIMNQYHELAPNPREKK